MPGRSLGHEDPPAGPLADRSAPNHTAGAHPALLMYWVLTGVAARSVEGCRPQAKTLPPRTALGLEGIACQHRTVARVAEAPGATSNVAINAVLAEGPCGVIDDPRRFDCVKVIGTDEHV